MNDKTAVCPQCNQMANHKHEGIQRGLPMRDNNKLYLYDVPLYTCQKCGSTWVDVDNRTNGKEVKQ